MTTVSPRKARRSFRIYVTPDRDRILVAPVGELDLATAGALEDEINRLRNDGFEEIVVDLRGLTFLDSTGLRLLVTARRKAMERGTRFSLIDGAPRVCRVFDITGLRTQFHFETASA